MNPLLPICLGILLVVILLAVRWKLKEKLEGVSECMQSASTMALRSQEVEAKDSIDDHLNSLTKKLAEKEGRLRISKSKIRETQCEIESLHSIDVDVRGQYKEVMEALRSDLVENEQECKRLQEQIEWVSRRRAEIQDDVRRGQKLYGEAAAELANNLTELRRGRKQSQLPQPQPELPQPKSQLPSPQTWCTHARHRAVPSFTYVRPLCYPATVRSD